MLNPGGIVLNLVFATILFYFLYGVIRAAVHDGIGQADERRRKRQQAVMAPRRIRQPDDEMDR